MKKTLFSLTMALAMGTMMAQSHEVLATNENGEKVVYEISDAAGSKGDTLSVTTYGAQTAVTEKDGKVMAESVSDAFAFDDDKWPLGLSFWEKWMNGIGFVVLLCVVMPIFIVLIVSIYNYRNRRAKYRVMEKLIESGQPIPDKLMESLGTSGAAHYDGEGGSLFEKGVRNTAIGLALIAFLWVLTDTAGVALVGLFVVAKGVAQLITYYKQGRIQKDLERKATQQRESRPDAGAGDE